MIVISHRANKNGPNPETENTKSEIDLRISEGFNVEIDVIGTESGELFLGHDSPQEQIDIEWLNQRKHVLWIHCKNPEALSIISSTGGDLNYFSHDTDFATLTSKGHIWGYPGKKIKRSIFVMPEWNDDDTTDALGVCTDFPELNLQDTYTLVIQGPIRKSTAEILQKYKSQHKNIIFSTWSGPDLEKFKKEFDFGGILLVENKQPIPDRRTVNHHNIYFQCFNTLKGLERSKTKFSIKLRSDEYYSNLQPIFDKVTDKKIVTNDLFFNGFDLSPFKPSDHVMGGTTENLLGMFKTAVETLKSPIAYRNNILNTYDYAKRHFRSKVVFNRNRLWVEVIPCISYLIYKKQNLKRTNAANFKLMFKEFFDVVITPELGEYIISALGKCPAIYENCLDKGGKKILTIDDV